MNFNVIKEPYVLTVVHARLGNVLFQLSAGIKYANDNNLNFYWAPLCADEALDYKQYIESSTLLNNLFRNLKDSYISEEFFTSRFTGNINNFHEGFNNIYKHGFSSDAFNYKPIPKVLLIA